MLPQAPYPLLYAPQSPDPALERVLHPTRRPASHEAGAADAAALATTQPSAQWAGREGAAVACGPLRTYHLMLQLGDKTVGGGGEVWRAAEAVQLAGAAEVGGGRPGFLVM